MVSTAKLHILKQTCSFQLQVCLSMCDLLVDLKGLTWLSYIRRATNHPDSWNYSKTSATFWTVVSFKLWKLKVKSKEARNGRAQIDITWSTIFPIPRIYRNCKAFLFQIIVCYMLKDNQCFVSFYNWVEPWKVV